MDRSSPHREELTDLHVSLQRLFKRRRTKRAAGVQFEVNDGGVLMQTYVDGWSLACLHHLIMTQQSF